MSYQEEQETLETVKYWWKKWGKLISIVLILILVAIIGFTGWSHFKQKKTHQAVILYEQYLAASEKTDIDHAKRIAADMQKNFSATAYASLSTLKLASMLVDKNELDLAKDQLNWIINHSSFKIFIPIAKLNMASILLDQKKYEAALNQLSDSQDGFKAAYADKRGDIFALNGQMKEALASYKMAINEIKADDSLRQFVQLKLDMLARKEIPKNAIIF